ncbi:MAG TPA: hypothetical protein VKD72_37795, partial [Gemmataceae bacterium]|nr:hypothetical protein [Gemmataceae bacterium]
MNIEALVIGASPGTDWVNLVPDFRAVFANQFLGQQLETPPGNTDPGLNQEPGVHLHWALPDGLTHGVASPNGQGADFPLIPNRWLVVRLWDQTEQKSELTLQFRAWIVESDTITDEGTGAIWLSVGAGNPNPQHEQDYSVRVGRQFELGQWPGETAASSIDISAVGYGDPSFAAYYPASRRMLGFYDSDLDDLQDVGLTYFVAGWYAKPDKDPLHRALTEATKDEEPQAVGGVSIAEFARLDAFLAHAQWIYPGCTEAGAKVQRAREVDANLKEAREMAQRLAASSEAKEALTALQTQITDLEKESGTLSGEINVLQQDLPGRIVCHGIVSGIRWQKKDTLHDSGIPRGKPFSVAVGNTAVEALAALFQTQLDSGVAKLLEAFQYDLLTELERPGGEEKFEQKIHERRYRPLSRGIRWDLIQETAASTDGPVDERTPPIPGDIRVLLESINSLQRDINRLKRERDSRKSELYATWYKKVLGSGDGSLTQPQIDLLSRQMRDLQDAIDGLTTQIAAREDRSEARPSGSQWDALQARLDTLLPGHELRALEELRFWRPNDPVVLLAGQAFQRTFRHGEDGRYRSDGRLLCRLSGQEFDGIKVTVPQAKMPHVPFGPGDVDRWCNPLPETGGG